jgi:hypothetical protein
MGPVIGPSGERLLMLGTVTIVFSVENRPYTHNFQVVEGGDLFILGNDFLAEHEAKVEAHLADDPVEGFVALKHKWGNFRAALVNDPNRHAVAAAVVTRPPVFATLGASLAAMLGPQKTTRDMQKLHGAMLFLFMGIPCPYTLLIT